MTLDGTAHHLDNSTPNYLDFGTLTLSEDAVDRRGPNELKISDRDDRWLIGLGSTILSFLGRYLLQSPRLSISKGLNIITM